MLLTLHRKPWTFVLRDSRGVAWFIHAFVKLEAINAASVFGRIVFWAGQFDILHSTVFIKSTVPLDESMIDYTMGSLLPHIKLFWIVNPSGINREFSTHSAIPGHAEPLAGAQVCL